MTRPVLAIALCLCLCLPMAARAEEAAGETRLVLGLSQCNPLGEQSYDHREGFRLELRMGNIHIWKLHPWLAMDTLTDGAGFWGGGLETDIDLSDEWVLTLQTGMGYLDDGTEHYTNQIYPPAGFEFRTQAEIAYKFKGGSRLGVGFSHISNAETRNPNPGLEEISLNAHIPLTLFSGKSLPVR